MPTPALLAPTMTVSPRTRGDFFPIILSVLNLLRKNSHYRGDRRILETPPAPVAVYSVGVSDAGFENLKWVVKLDVPHFDSSESMNDNELLKELNMGNLAIDPQTKE